MSQVELEATARKAVLLYNRLKSPEAFAKIVTVSPERITILFSGSFCYSCTFPLKYIQDFIEDFKVISNKFELTVGSTRQASTNSFEADYQVRAR